MTFHYVYNLFIYWFHNCRQLIIANGEETVTMNSPGAQLGLLLDGLEEGKGPNLPYFLQYAPFFNQFLKTGNAFLPILSARNPLDLMRYTFQTSGRFEDGCGAPIVELNSQRLIPVVGVYLVPKNAVEIEDSTFFATMKPTIPLKVLNGWCLNLFHVFQVLFYRLQCLIRVSLSENSNVPLQR